LVSFARPIAHYDWSILNFTFLRWLQAQRGF
jgi:hypothetical protein